ncbi:MAG: glycosyltransferase family 4 protein [Pseudomonadota bacterium]
MTSDAPILILTERAPLDPSKPATGLTIRHTRMAQCWAAQGRDVTYAWPCAADPEHGGYEHADGFMCLPIQHPDTVRDWARARSNVRVMLGYWELHRLVPVQFQNLILDYVAPRLLERAFEDDRRVSDDLHGLIPLLSRCASVWVGNASQRDLMVPLMMLAGHAMTATLPIQVVPISGPVIGEPADARAGNQALVLFHGGQDWPWRQSERWLNEIGNDHGAGIELVNANDADTFTGFDAYLDRLQSVDVVLELSDDNLERRYSQSFRACDALCSGVPIIANRFLPIAAWINEYSAGWVIDEPAQLGPLLHRLANDRDEIQAAALRALRLAAERLDQANNYALGGPCIPLLSEAAPNVARTPLIDLGDSLPDVSTVSVVKQAARRQFGHIIHHSIARMAKHRPLPEPGNSTWIMVSRDDIVPANHGAAVKIERTAQALSSIVDRVLLVTDQRHHYWDYQHGDRVRKRFPLRMRLPGWPRRLNEARLMAKGLPQSDCFLYRPLVDRGLHLRLLWLINRYPVEVVQGDFPAYAHPAIWASIMFGTRSVLVEHNVEFRRMAEQLPDLSPVAAVWLQHQEVSIANACDRVITVSERDREQLVQAGVSAGHMQTIPHGVDWAAFDRAEAKNVRTAFGLDQDQAVLVYHGTYSYPPNLDAIKELSNAIVPALQAKGVSAVVLAIGPNPPTQRIPGVIFTGPVDDLAGYLKAGDVAVVPLRDGGGTRMKILDYFAAGIPVVSTSKGMEGIEVEHSVQLRVVDEVDAMATAIVELLTSPSARQQQVDQARQWVSQYDWRAIAARYVEFVRTPL